MINYFQGIQRMFDKENNTKVFKKDELEFPRWEGYFGQKEQYIRKVMTS